MDRLVKTEGIVLNKYPYKESSLIVRILTKELGLRSYILNNIRTYKKQGSKIALFEPLTILDLVVYNKHAEKLNRISSFQHLYSVEVTRPEQNFLLLFIADLTANVLNRLDSDEDLYTYIRKSIELIGRSHISLTNYHLYFTIHLFYHLGIGLESAGQLAEESKRTIDSKVRLLVDQLIQAQGIESLPVVDRTTRNETLDVLIDHLRYQIEGFEIPKSIAILRELG